MSLPGADELFRSTGGPVTRFDSDDELETAPVVAVRADRGPVTDAEPRSSRGGTRGTGLRQPSGRQRHDEKITVYVSPIELVDLEHARLMLRAEQGLAIDRGRIVREALAVVLADFESKGDESILVRRLRAT